MEIGFVTIAKGIPLWQVSREQTNREAEQSEAQFFIQESKSWYRLEKNR